MGQWRPVGGVRVMAKYYFDVYSVDVSKENWFTIYYPGGGTGSRAGWGTCDSQGFSAVSSDKCDRYTEVPCCYDSIQSRYSRGSYIKTIKGDENEYPNNSFLNGYWYIRRDIATSPKVNVNGEARDISKVYVNINGQAREVTSMYANINGQAKEVL